MSTPRTRGAGSFKRGEAPEQDVDDDTPLTVLQRGAGVVTVGSNVWSRKADEDRLQVG